MMSSPSAAFIKDMLIIGGLISIQTVFSVYMLGVASIVKLGVHPLFLITLGSMFSAFILFPFAVVFERKKWPARIKPIFVLQMVILSLFGSTYESFSLLGIKRTSATISSAMSILVPGITFVIAVLTGFEKFSVQCKWSRAKVLGTIVCLTGAMMTSIWMRPAAVTTSEGFSNFTNPREETINSEWILGCFFILLSVTLTACTTILQAAAIVHFPAPLSLMIIYCLMESAMTALLQFVTEGMIGPGASSSLSVASIIVFMLMGAATISVLNPYQVWCISIKGPVLVSIFNPLQTICTALISAIFLGQVLKTIQCSRNDYYVCRTLCFLMGKRKRTWQGEHERTYPRQ